MQRTSIRRSWTAITLAAVFVIVGALPALANVADPLPPTTATATSNANGSTTVTVHGTWKWSTQTGTASDPCGGQRFGVGWAIAWNDP